MTVHAPAQRPRILAKLADRPGLTAYELAAALGYRKPDSRRINEIVRRLWNDGALVSGTVYRPGIGRQARIYYIAPPGTRPRLTVEPPGGPSGAGPATGPARPAREPGGQDGHQAGRGPAPGGVGPQRRPSAGTANARRAGTPTRTCSSGPAASGPGPVACVWRRPGPTASAARSEWPASRWPGPTGRRTASGAAPTSKPSAPSAQRKRPSWTLPRPAGPDPHRSSTQEGIGMTVASEYGGGSHAHQIYLEGAAAAVDALSASAEVQRAEGDLTRLQETEAWLALAREDLDTPPPKSTPSSWPRWAPRPS